MNKSCLLQSPLFESSRFPTGKLYMAMSDCINCCCIFLNLVSCVKSYALLAVEYALLAVGAENACTGNTQTTWHCVQLHDILLCVKACAVPAVGAENARTGKTMAEKMVKIMEERLKEKAAVADKLQSKNHALKVPTQLPIFFVLSSCLSFCQLTAAACQAPVKPCQHSLVTLTRRQCLLLVQSRFVSMSDANAAACRHCTL